ncbi:hypothetical protein F5887DRAFT_940413 [Amanita rubescens]|nr:hypothetical protein F5887DRAFT_940413 [Amanita rubescens]
MFERPKALSPAQERRLVDHLDERFLELTRGFKKRSEPNSTFSTLSNYLAVASKILVLILQIPPIDPSTSLRTAFLLRLTNEVLNSIAGYAPTTSALADAVSWLDDLDQAWLVVLQSQVWDADNGEGVDLLIEADDAAAGVKSTPMNQTEITRLRSLLVSAMAELEEWLDGGRGDERDDVESRLKRLGLQDKFDELFSGSLDFLGGVGGFVVEPLSTID